MCAALTMEAAEKQFEEYFQKLDAADLKRSIYRILYWRYFLQSFKFYIKLMFTLALLYWAINTFDCIAWLLSALMRLALIQLLPYWNWKPLYNAKCLIERNMEMEQSTSSLPQYETWSENCLLCASMESIPAVANVSFAYLETNYLESGSPVIITDSHASKNLQNFLSKIFEHAVQYLATEPCDINTNLMLKQRFNMELALEKLKTSAIAFLQLRNCQFKAVKWSRIFIEKPYYYPLHLKPFYSSWLIFARNYYGQQMEIYVKGLILMQQWQGVLHVGLMPKAPCAQQCPELKLRLMAGEALLFSTDLWIPNYNLATNNESVTTILEIDWQQ